MIFILAGRRLRCAVFVDHLGLCWTSILVKSRPAKRPHFGEDEGTKHFAVT